MKMIKLMACAALAAACAVGFTGCGSKDYSTPKVAEGAVCALAMRSPAKTSLSPLIEKYKLNDYKAAVEQLPADAKDLFNELELEKVDTKWVLVTVGGEIAMGKIPDVAIVVATTLDLDKVVAAAEKDKDKNVEFKKKDVAGVPAYEIVAKGEEVVPCVASLDGKLIIGASSAAVLEKQIALYRDGKGASADFSSFGLSANDILRVTAVKAGETVKKALPDQSMLQAVTGMIPDGDKLVLGLGVIELTATTDEKDVKLGLSVETASDADADKLRTVAKTGLMGLTAQLKEGADKDTDTKMAYEALQSAKVEGEGKIAKLSITFSAELPIKNFLKYRTESQRTACFSNMRQIESASEMYILNHPDKVPTMDDLCGPDKYIKAEPQCPLGGKYKISQENGAIVVTCPHAAEGHVLSN
jgi:hypothetical protein